MMRRSFLTQKTGIFWVKNLLLKTHKNPVFATKTAKTTKKPAKNSKRKIKAEITRKFWENRRKKSIK